MDINKENHETKEICNEVLSEQDEQDIDQTMDREPIISFEYDVKNEEEDRAFLTFQKKYVYKRNIGVTVAFGIVALLFGYNIIKNPNGYLNWVLGFLCISVIFIQWYNTFRIRKYLVKALKVLEDDRYKFSLYDDCFKIETLISEEEKNSDDYKPIKPSIVRFDETPVSVIENHEMFIVIQSKESLYVLAKRILDKNQTDILRDNFRKILGDNFESKEN